jgi:hypothetical protein
MLFYQKSMQRLCQKDGLLLNMNGEVLVFNKVVDGNIMQFIDQNLIFFSLDDHLELIQ